MTQLFFSITKSLYSETFEKMFEHLDASPNEVATTEKNKKRKEEDSESCLNDAQAGRRVRKWCVGAVDVCPDEETLEAVQEGGRG